MKLSNEEFLKVVEATPLVSIDLVVRNQKGHILMGKRINRPAINSWFVPGGRIIKGENVDSALTRIGKDELNIELNRKDVRFIGLFDHRYKNDNFANIAGISTQYIVIAYECYLCLDIDELPKEQHSDWDWFCKSQADKVHKNSAAYFEAVEVAEADNITYSALNTRHDSYNNLLWQTPAMSLIAQAFLFTIILSSSTEPFSRIIAVILAVFTSFASVHLLAKHRHGEINCAIELRKIEDVTGRYPMNLYPKSKSLLLTLSSYRIWLFTLSLFGIAALFVIIRPFLITAIERFICPLFSN